MGLLETKFAEVVSIVHMRALRIAAASHACLGDTTRSLLLAQVRAKGSTRPVVSTDFEALCK